VASAHLKATRHQSRNSPMFSSRSKAPSASNHCGWTKWCSVTSGSMPRLRAPRPRQRHAGALSIPLLSRVAPAVRPHQRHASAWSAELLSKGGNGDAASQTGVACLMRARARGSLSTPPQVCFLLVQPLFRGRIAMSTWDSILEAMPGSVPFAWCQVLYPLHGK